MSTERFKTNLKAQQNRARRGWVLRILNYFNNEKSRDLNDKIIQDGLQEAGHGVPLPVLHADLRYLEERGYVHLTQAEMPFTMMVARITSKGVDLYEGTVEDEGIDFERDS